MKTTNTGRTQIYENADRDQGKGTPVFTCPLPMTGPTVIQMAHGGGGRLSHELIERVFLPAFANDALNARHDGALLDLNGQRLAFTSDSHVVTPLFFPGGDIGKLAVCGTVNDLAMCGARPLWLSASFILEEGLPIETLQRIVESMRLAAAEAGVKLVTGDTKVVDRGKGDGLYINTSGIGGIERESMLPSRIQPGDAILLSGDLARHGIAVMAEREALAFESTIESDCASLAKPVMALLEAGLEIHCLRDLTRGGLATALVEIGTSAKLNCRIDETCIPVREDVRGACEILGLDPLYVANEGRFVAFLPAVEANRAIEVLRQFDETSGVTTIGVVGEGLRESHTAVTMKSTIGVDRIVDMLSGEQLPRIC
ncbi:MAG: hydrogenase expression/formation protein HypE [Opitutales bacterium]